MKKIILLFTLLLSLSAGAQDSLVVFFANNSIELTPLALEKLENLKKENAVIVRIEAFASNTGAFANNSRFLAPGRGTATANYLGFTGEVNSSVSNSPAATERKVVVFYTKNSLKEVSTSKIVDVTKPFVIDSIYTVTEPKLVLNMDSLKYVADSVSYYDSMSRKTVVVPTQCDSAFLVNQYLDNGYKFPAKIVVDTTVNYVDITVQLEQELKVVQEKLRKGKKSNAKKIGLKSFIDKADLLAHNTVADNVLQSPLFGDGMFSFYGNMNCGGKMTVGRRAINHIIVTVASAGILPVLHYAQKGIFGSVKLISSLFYKRVNTKKLKVEEMSIRENIKKYQKFANVCAN